MYYIDISTSTYLPLKLGGGGDEAITTCICVKLLDRPQDNFPAMFVVTQTRYLAGFSANKTGI